MNDKSQRANLSMFQRAHHATTFEMRSLDGGKRMELTGYASTTEQPYEMFDYWGDTYDEVLARGSFGKTLAEGADVSFLTNHGGLTLARTTSSTLRLEEDSTGLLSIATLNTERGDANDLVIGIRDGDITEMSFAFRIVKQEWSPDWMTRRITEVNLNKGDVSAVNYGANPNTSIGLARAYSGQGQARVARLAQQMRAGQLDDVSAAVVAHILDLVAAADMAVDKAQPLLADLINVPNPDVTEDSELESARSAAHLHVLRLIEAERQYRKAG